LSSNFNEGNFLEKYREILALFSFCCKRVMISLCQKKKPRQKHFLGVMPENTVENK